MATSTLVRVPTDDDAALIALALREKGINITEQFWMTPSEPHWKVLGLVSPDRDAPDGYDLYGKIFAALESFPYADRSFIGGRMMVFGQKKFRKEIEMIHSGFTKLSEIGPYRDVEIEPIPQASEIRKSGLLWLIPLDRSNATVVPCTVQFAPFSPSSYSGATRFRRLESESELGEILEYFGLPASEQERIFESLKRGQSCDSVLYDIGLDTLYRLKLI
jgi:hypothetical protein